MATISELLVKIGVDDSGLKSGVSSVTGEIARIGGAFLSIQTIMKGIDYNKVAEQATVALKTMTGSAETAKKTVQDLQQFAAKTPFEFAEVRAAGQQLIAFGTAAGDVTDVLRMVGDVASGVGAPLQEMAYLYGQIQSQGRAMTQDLNQFAMRGIPIYDELAKHFNTTTVGVRELAAAGKIGFADIEAAFGSMTGEGGRFFNLMEEQSKTLAGAQSNLADSFYQFLGIMTEGMTGPLKKSFVDIAAALSGMGKEGAKIGEVFGGVISYLSEIVVAVLEVIGQVPGELTAVAVAAGAAALAFGPIGAAIAAIVVGMGMLDKARKDAEAALDAAWAAYNNINKLFEEGITAETDVMKSLEQANMELIRLEQMRATEQYKNDTQHARDVEVQIEKTKTVRTQLVDIARYSALGRIETEKAAKAEAERADAAKASEAAIAAAAEAAAEAREKAEKKYVDARGNVLQILESEKDAYQKIQDKIAEINKTPWAAGTALEKDRLAAVQILNDQLVELEKKKNEDILAFEQSFALKTAANDEERRQDELAKLEIEYNAAIALAEQKGADTATIEAYYRQEREKLDNESAEKSKSAWDSWLEGVTKDATDWMDVLQQSMGVVSNYLVDSFNLLSDSIQNGTDNWKAWGKVGLGALSKILDALGAQLAAQAIAALFDPATWGIAALAGIGAAAAFGAAALARSQMDALANGTDFARGGATLVGERGPEIVNLPQGASVTPNHEMGAMNGGNVSIVINSPETLNAVDAARELRRSVRVLQRERALA